MSDYNGWTNWETWQIGVWLSNDEPTYRMKVEFLKEAEITARSVRDFCLEIYPTGTPDMDGVRDMFEVNWDELAEYWTAEREEYCD